MKKYRSLIIFAVILSLIGFFGILKPQQTQKTGKQIPVEISVENGETTLTEKNVNAITVFDALVAVTKKRQLSLKTKTYDFGIFVEQIGALPNTKEKAWIYYVNGKSGTVAADKQTLQSGDTVEWKYEKPLY